MPRSPDPLSHSLGRRAPARERGHASDGRSRRFARLITITRRRPLSSRGMRPGGPRWPTRRPEAARLRTPAKAFHGIGERTQPVTRNVERTLIVFAKVAQVERFRGEPSLSEATTTHSLSCSHPRGAGTPEGPPYHPS